MAGQTWEPQNEISREAIIAASGRVLSMPDQPITVHEDLFRIQAGGLPWDIGCKVYEPADAAQIPRGADGKLAGMFMLHGGEGDYRSQEPLARLIAAKFGYKVVCMTFPGKLYLHDPSRDWPGDTINPDGTARTPIWLREETITPDQYELVEDRSDPAKRAKWGTLFFLRAREGTVFYDRMAAWPLAFEEGMLAACHRHFPAGEFSIYAHGHSTGGPFIHMLLQRAPNIAGLIGTETSPFGFIFGRMIGMQWHVPFNYLTVRTWRHIAKYVGAEAGPDGHRRLPWLMEDVFEAWDRAKKRPQFKAEYFITYAAVDALAEAARVTARRLGLGPAGTEALVRRYQSYTCELTGPDTRPVPPLLYGITRGSRDHTPERYREIVLPALAAMNPAPKARVVQFQAGVHGYAKPEPDLPIGVVPAIVTLWHDAITKGYYVV